jgi:hypothetical protein
MENEKEIFNFRNIAYTSLTAILLLVILSTYGIMGLISKTMPGEVGFVFGILFSVFVCMMIYIYLGILRTAEVDREDELEEVIRSVESDQDEEEDFEE